MLFLVALSSGACAAPSPRRRGKASVALSSGACAAPKFATVPGQTEISVSGVSILARAGEHLEVNYKELYEYMGLRKKDPVRPERSFNEFRLAEDRRRIEAYLHEHGHFDAQVDEPELKYSDDHKAVAVTWHVSEGPAYKIGRVELIGAPAEHADLLRSMIPFHAGDEIELETYRPLRRTMAERLQDEGYGHARGYSRTFVDKESKTVNWFYYIDAGPRTKIGSIVVEGNTKVPAPIILARAGLTVNGTYSLLFCAFKRSSRNQARERSLPTALPAVASSMMRIAS